MPVLATISFASFAALLALTIGALLLARRQ